MSKLKRLPFIYLIFFIIMIIVNYFAGQNVGDVADQYETLIQPAGYAFSIWSVIYIALFAWIIRMMLVKNARNMIHLSLQWLPVMNFALNSIWIVVFTQEWLFASNIVIIVLWLTIFAMYRQASKGDYHWLDRLPLSLYLGWITLATVVNIFAWLDQIGVNFGVAPTEAIIVSIVIVLISAVLALFSIRNHDWILPLVAVWTFIAILSNADTGSTVFYVVIIIVNALLLLTAFANFTQSKRRYREYRKNLF